MVDNRPILETVQYNDFLNRFRVRVSLIFVGQTMLSNQNVATYLLSVCLFPSLLARHCGWGRQ